MSWTELSHFFWTIDFFLFLKRITKRMSARENVCQKTFSIYNLIGQLKYCRLKAHLKASNSVNLSYNITNGFQDEERELVQTTLYCWKSDSTSQRWHYYPGLLIFPKISWSWLFNLIKICWTFILHSKIPAIRSEINFIIGFLKIHLNCDTLFSFWPLADTAL